MSEDRCVSCGAIVPEGRMVCPICEKQKPSVDVVERKKGKWIPQNYNKTNGFVSTAVYYYPACSVCGLCANYTNYCPNCGADMRGGKNDAEIH